MRNLIVVFICFGISFGVQATPSLIIISPSFTGKDSLSKPKSPEGIFSMKVKDVEKFIGRKLSLKERIAYKIFKHRIFKAAQKNDNSDKGQLSFILGIVGLVILFIPYLGLVALPCAILAVVFGYEARRADPSNRKARTGIILGWITIGLFVLALLLAIAILSSITF